MGKPICSIDEFNNTNSTPTLVVERDWEGYFERLVQMWLLRVTNPKHKTIIITGSPYQASAVSYESEGDTITFSFYPALRIGFGSLSREDTAQLIELI